MDLGRRGERGLFSGVLHPLFTPVTEQVLTLQSREQTLLFRLAAPSGQPVSVGHSTTPTPAVKTGIKEHEKQGVFFESTGPSSVL